MAGILSRPQCAKLEHMFTEEISLKRVGENPRN